ncbi:phosphoribosylaminoimidazole carboxylase, PurE protein [Halobacteroides halobius DSM 5150]|uniref:N5-carboxyaminoimidazole ribonucleotide mutase n=1 Tax=Halobacteroides halobius (strain ATCC 35273 / DSM 5150 / MD-1) TaxID=748449 RepID=L0KAY8_HALHC|nr:5-(carboxyamino)imidazole ribonucleotide mutase [Halobacteroides halobius]AGB42462.1 phosphoribosylaminoimidazole carboxylase, PurE protein [Halobacteroides halobius DSM 5150]
MKTKVGIIMGSDSDLPVMKDAAKILEKFDISYEITVVSAHRTPDRVSEYAESAEERGIDVIVAGAGGAAHLPGMTASHTSLPVIGVPIKTSKLNGVDSLYSIVQMPGGVPVATVGINGAKNAGLLAIQMLGINNQKLRDKFMKYKAELAQSVKKTARELENLGYQDYLDKQS